MGISLKDIFSNDTERLVENKRKKAIKNMIILGLIVFLLIILTILYKFFGNMSENRRNQITRDIQNIQIAVLGYSARLDEEEYPGTSLEDDPIVININGINQEYRYGYYLLQSGDLREISVSLNLPNEVYIVSYDTGDVVNYKGVKYKNRIYHSIDDIQAIANGQTPVSDTIVVINEPSDLNKIRSNPAGYYILSSNIDMTAYSGEEGWTPIPDFSGVFDGRGYTISNLKISRPNQNYVGLFGNVKNSATIANLNIENVNVVGGQYTGVLAGSCAANVSRISIKNANITGFNGFTGGICGTYSIGSLTDCTVEANVDGDRDVGGVIGALYNGTVNRVRVSGNIAASDSAVGGLVGLARISDSTNIGESSARVLVNGKNSLGGLIGTIEITAANTLKMTDCYIKGSIETGENGIGGVIGNIYTAQGTPVIDFKNIYSDVSIVVKNETSGGFIGSCNISNSITQNGSNCFWKKELAPGETLNDIGTKTRFTTLTFDSKNAEEMTMLRTYVDWDFEKIWSIEERASTPFLKWEKDYIMEEATNE